MEAKLSDAHSRAGVWAAKMLAREPQQWCILDIETNGLEGVVSIVEIAVIDGAGQTLFATRINPRCPIPAAASAIHGIYDEDVANAPTFEQVYEQLATALCGRHVVIYHADYDTHVLWQECLRYRLPLLFPHHGWIGLTAPLQGYISQ